MHNNPSRYMILFLRGLLMLAVSTCFQIAQAEILEFGSDLPEPIFSIYIPETRTDEPVIATEHFLYSWNPDSSNWNQIYQPPWKDSKIIAVTGYAKSSKVLYVAHTSGIARSGDGGDSWVESLPFQYRDHLHDPIEIKVNPTAREHAVLIASHQAWETSDYGQSWHLLDGFTSEKEKVAGVHFINTTDQENANLLIATESGIRLYEGLPLQHKLSWLASNPLAVFRGHPKMATALAVFRDKKTTFVAFDIEEKLVFSRPETALHATATDPMISGDAAVWTQAGNKIGIAELTPESPVLNVAEFPYNLTAFARHPDLPDAAYCAAGNQLYLLSNAFADLPSGIIAQQNPLPSSGDQTWPPSLPASSSPPSDSPPHNDNTHTSIANKLDALIRSQTPFRDVLQAAISHSEGSPADFAKWEKIARRRNWLPDLRIEGGLRERNTDNNFLYEPVDAYGIPGDPEDLNLPDKIRTLGFAAVVLQWDLNELVFDPEQVDIRRERRYTQEHRRELIQDLSEVYHDRIRKMAQQQGLFGPLKPDQYIILTLEIEELSEILNGFCGQVLF